jgi:hypothetical protein
VNTISLRTPHLTPAFANLPLSEVLQAPISALVGVTDASADAVEHLGITTVFDLGTSWVFARAEAASEATRSAPDADIPPGSEQELVVGTDAPREAWGELALEFLNGVSAELATTLTVALTVATIRDFAFWPPRLVAVRLVRASIGSTFDPDDEQTEKLRPRFGEYPTERVYFPTLVMLQFPPSPKSIELDRPVSLKPLGSQTAGFQRPAVGALLTFAQSWYAQGITLGHLLHCLALAPGEGTRVAVVDWSRRQRASTTERITETEDLDNDTSHSRAVSEVQNAVARELQAGESMTSGWARSRSTAEQSTVGTGFFASLFASGSSSSAEQTGATATEVESSSWSLGRRGIAARTAQRVNDRTEQHASAVRSRRASIVHEVSQSEHEEVSTRVVANYNHMHALTVQYYEVIQIYRVEAQLQEAERCLFVPIEILDFGAPRAIDVVDRFRRALARGALTARARELLADETSAVEIVPETPTRLPATRVERVVSLLERHAGALLDAIQVPPAEGDGPPVAAPASTIPAGALRSLTHVLPGGLQVSSRLWNLSEISVASRFASRALVRPGSDNLHFSDEALIAAVSVDGVTIKTVHVSRAGGGKKTFAASEGGHVDFDVPIRLGELDTIQLAKADDAPASGRLVLHLVDRGNQFESPGIPIELGAGTALKRVVRFVSDGADRRKELLAHLQEHREHYSRVVCRSLDSAALVALLSPYEWNGRPLVDQIEPRPLTFAGNYMVLRAPVELDESSGIVRNGSSPSWKEVLEDRGLDFEAINPRLVTIPTGGVFAEAVLGRSNSAEKLDITRFWDWQDSPIPLVPTEIAPVVTGSRATPDDMRPGALSPPLLNIVNPTTLPDPTGLGPTLQALASGNIFRDMSGLAGTQQLAQGAVSGTLSAATAAGQIASANLRTEAQKAVAMAQIAADLAKSLLGGGAGGGKGTGKSLSADGARINHGRDLDRRIGTTPTQPAGSPVSPVSPSRSGSSSGAGGGGGARSGPETAAHGYSREAAFADAGALGYSPDAVNSTLGPAATGQPPGEGGTGDPFDEGGAQGETYEFMSSPGPARNRLTDAFFVDEWSADPHPDGLHFSRFSVVSGGARIPLTAFVDAQNPLDITVNPSLLIPEDIPDQYVGVTARSLPGAPYFIYVPEPLRARVAAGSAPAEVKVSVLFCVGDQINRAGLRSFFERFDDRVLITVPGREREGGVKAWGIGIDATIVRDLFALAGLGALTPSISVLACYSTGYRGLNGTINNELLDLSKVQRVVFYDALYRGDDPLPGTVVRPPDLHREAPRASGFNTWRALEQLKGNAGLEVIAYEVTPGGTPRYSDGRRLVDLPPQNVINLKTRARGLNALVLARLLDGGLRDGLVREERVPRPVLDLIQTLPARGNVVSEPRTGLSGLPLTTTLDAWAADHASEVDGTWAARNDAFGLVFDHWLMGWQPRKRTNVQEMWHDQFMPEFAWEYLTGP